MADKAKMKKGIVGLTYWKATATTNPTTGEISVSYGAAHQLKTLTSGGREYSIEPRGESQSVYADSIKVYGDSINDGYDIDLTVLSTLDGDINKDWLQNTETEDGLAEYANVPEMPYFGLAIYEETSDGEGLTTFFPWVQASGRPSDAGKTAEGGAFDWAFPTIPLAATPRPSDKLTRLLVKGKTRLTEVPDGTQVSGIELSEHRIALVEDDEYTLTALTVPAGASVTWSEGSTSVATVSGGVVTAEGAGNTIITASITDSGVTYTDTCTVIVTAKT